MTKNKSLRTEVIHVRVTPEEKRKIKEKAKVVDASVSEFLWQMSMNNTYTNVEIGDIIRFDRLFSNIANNMNQIAVKLNKAGKNDTLNDELLTEIYKIFNEIKSTINEHQLKELSMIEELYRITKSIRRFDEDEIENEDIDEDII